MRFWATIAIEAEHQREADSIACAMSEDVEGRVIFVQAEPPEGCSTIVGNFEH
jgi:hypothetical protein